MKAVILAGGKGTRLGELTIMTPKPLLSIANTSVIQHQVGVLARYDIRDITVCVHYQSEAIQSALGDGSSYGVHLSYAYEKEARGTAGALRDSLSKDDGDVLVLYGDVMFDMDIPRLFEFHKERGADVTLVVHPNDHPQDSDLVDIDESGKVMHWFAKPHKQAPRRNLVNAGIAVVNASIAECIPSAGLVDLGKDIWPALVNTKRIYGYQTSEYMKDMGTPERYQEVTRDYENGELAKRNFSYSRPAAFLDRDGVINKEVNHLHQVEQLELLPGVAEAIHYLNKAGFLVLVVTNQPVVARGLCSISDLKKIHNQLETLLGYHGAFIDRIYFCPHHPDKGFEGENAEFKIICDCRKPGIGMIQQAQRDFNIDMSRSFIVGDSDRDILCGQHAGIYTIGIHDNENQQQYSVEPNEIQSSLLSAVEQYLVRVEAQRHTSN